MTRLVAFSAFVVLLVVPSWSQESQLGRNILTEPPRSQPSTSPRAQDNYDRSRMTDTRAVDGLGDIQPLSIPSIELRPKSDKKESQEERIARLEGQIAELKNSIEKLMAMQMQQNAARQRQISAPSPRSEAYERLPNSQGYDAIPQAMPPQQQPPNTWQRFRFNGADFYVIPVGEINSVGTKIQRPQRYQYYDRR